MLIPYHSHDISFIHETIKASLCAKNNLEAIDIAANFGECSETLIDYRHIRYFKAIFKEAYYKLVSFGNVKKQILSIHITDPISALIAFIDKLSSSNISKNLSSTIPPVEKMAVEFYYVQQEATCFFDRLFLYFQGQLSCTLV